jgi:hypothetical protein
MSDRFNYKQTAEFIAKRTKSTRVVRFFPNADLRCSHDGLRLIAKENGIDPWELAPGEFLVFMNTNKNMMKIYAPGNVLAHVKSPDNRRIDLDIVRYIPRFFNGTEFKFEKALEKMVSVKVERAA